jgi:hypothetical protein
MRLLRPSDYRVMPWKNGLGTTTEIAVDPPGADLDAFGWRISVADLGASGPFSVFPGVDRILVQIEGEPMELVHEGGVRRRLAPLSPYRFPGELPTVGELATPPARDFNVMVRRDRWTAGAGVHVLPRGGAARLLSAASARLVYALRGALAIRADASAADLGGGEALLVEGDGGATRGGGLEIAAGSGDAIAVVVDLARSPGWRSP